MSGEGKQNYFQFTYRFSSAPRHILCCCCVLLLLLLLDVVARSPPQGGLISYSIKFYNIPSAPQIANRISCQTRQCVHSYGLN
jgi:hypothetical protein